MTTDDEILEVTRPGGYLISRDYANMLRRALKLPPMSKETYKAAVTRAVELGREAVVTMRAASHERFRKKNRSEFLTNTDPNP